MNLRRHRYNNYSWDTPAYRNMKKKVRSLSSRELMEYLDQAGTEASWYVQEYRKRSHYASLEVIHDNISAMQAIIEELQLDHKARNKNQ